MTENAPRIESFEEFWPFYLGEHAKPATRWFHFVGTGLGMAVGAWAIVTGQPWLAPLAVLPGYGFAWFSHFFIEKNKPASFTYPLWSFIADFKLFGLMITGRISREVERLGVA